MRPHRRQSGFTLVELMAASVITAFLAMVAVGGLVSITSARNTLDEATAVMDELRYVADRLRQDLANAHRDRQEMLFEGLFAESGMADVPQLRFRTVSTAKARPNQPESDVYEVEYLFVPARDGTMQLSRRQCPIVGIEEERHQTAGGVLTRLSEHVSLFGVRYFDGGQWLTAWPVEQRQLPMIVEVSLASRVVEESGYERIYAKQVIVTFPRIGDQTTDEEEAAMEIEFTDPEAGL